MSEEHPEISDEVHKQIPHGKVSKLGETEENEHFAALAETLSRLVEDERGFDLAVRGRTYHFIPGNEGWVVTAKNLEMSSRHLFLQFAPGDAFIRIESDPCQAEFSVVIPIRDGDGTTVREARA